MIPGSERRAPATPFAVAFLLLAAVLLLLFAAAAWRVEVPRSYAEVVIPPDEPLTVTTDSQAANQPPMTMASVTGSAASLAMSLPGSEAVGRLLSAVDEVGLDPLTTQVLRTTSTAVDADGSLNSSITVGMLLDTGYHEVLGMTPAGDVLWYQPSLMQLPGSLEPGTRWGSNGLTVGAAPFTFLGAVLGATDRVGPIGPVTDTSDCVDVETRLDQQIPDSENYLVERVTTWCPGWGSVASLSVRDGVATRLGEPDEAAWTEPRLLTPATRPSGTSLPLPIPVVSIVLPPVATPAGIVMANGWIGDLLGVTVGEADSGNPDGFASVTWMQRPGESVLGLAADGDHVYATTSRRSLIAFDQAGRMRWSSPLPDVAVGSPAVLGDTVVVSLLDGTLRAFSAASGAPRWTDRLSDVVIQGPVVAGDLVVAGDANGHTVGVTESGTTRWSAELDPVDGPLTALPSGVVLIPQSSGAVTAHDADGQELWTRYVPEGSVTGPGALVGRVIALPTSAGLLGLDPQTGQVVWTRESLPSARVAPNGLVASGSTVHSISEAGEVSVVAQVREPDGSEPLGLHLTRLGSQWVAVTRGGALTFLGESDGAPLGESDG